MNKRKLLNILHVPLHSTVKGHIRNHPRRQKQIDEPYHAPFLKYNDLLVEVKIENFPYLSPL